MCLYYRLVFQAAQQEAAIAERANANSRQESTNYAGWSGVGQSCAGILSGRLDSRCLGGCGLAHWWRRLLVGGGLRSLVDIGAVYIDLLRLALALSLSLGWCWRGRRRLRLVLRPADGSGLADGDVLLRRGGRLG